MPDHTIHRRGTGKTPIEDQHISIYAYSMKHTQGSAFFLQFGLLCLLLAVSSQTLAAISITSGQRKLFLSAEKTAKSGTPVAAPVKALLRNYPLYPYIEYAELKAQINSAATQAIQSFLQRNQDTPLAGLLRSRWLGVLAQNQDWPAYLEHYQPQRSIRLQCHYLHALIATGRQEQAFSRIEPIWLYGKSRPKACDPVFKAWRKAGRLTHELIWQRIELAIAKSQMKLANYLAQLLPRQDKTWVQLWISLHRNPDKALKSSLLKKDHKYRNRILVDLMYRKISKNPLAAGDFWLKLKQKYHIPKQSQHLVERKMVLWLTRKDTPEAWQLIKSTQPCSHDIRLQEARIRSALYREKWAEVSAWIRQLPAQEQQSERWRYWQARALEEQGNQASAKKIYDTLARERSFYGFLAADRSGHDYHLASSDSPVSKAILKSFAKKAGVKRVKELLALQRWTDARREWRFLTRNLSEQQYMVAAELAQSWNWHDQAIFTLAKSGYWDDLELRFPLEHKELVKQNARKQKLDMSWVYGVIRQESAFNASVRSYAGAVGLMQLMPATARFVAKKLLKKKHSPKRNHLIDPKINIELGTTYLANVKSRLNDNPVLATAAYNAGPHRVKRWLPKTLLPADIWVELIPFKETRQYVQRVFTYAVIYDHRLQRPITRLSQRMLPIQGTEVEKTANNIDSKNVTAL